MRFARTKKALAIALPVAALFGVTGCATATTACVVRHRYAIVIFQNGVGNNTSSFVSRFRLNITYRRHSRVHWLIYSHIVINATKSGNPSVVVRTYLVGHARSCSVDRVIAHQ